MTDATSHRRMPTAPVPQDRTKPLRCEIDPDVIVAQADGSSVWHIMDDRDMPICRNRPYREFIEHAPFSWLEAQGDRVCRDCHRRQSWTPMPQDVVLEDRGYETPCRIWIRGLTGKGYAERIIPGVKVPTHAHREAYEAAYGAIPAGHVIHHRCEQRDCIEPTHLEPMSRADHCRLHRPGDHRVYG